MFSTEEISISNLCDGANPNISPFDMKEISSRDRSYGWANLTNKYDEIGRKGGNKKTYGSSSVDDIDSESVCSLPCNIVSVDARNKDLALMVVNKQASDHVLVGGLFLLRPSILKIYLFMWE